MLLDAVETTVRTLLSYTFEWLQMPPLLPPSLLQDGKPAPAAEPADPEEQAAARSESPQIAGDATPVNGVLAAAALALAGRARIDGDERKKQPLPR